MAGAIALFAPRMGTGVLQPVHRRLGMLAMMPHQGYANAFRCFETSFDLAPELRVGECPDLHGLAPVTLTTAPASVAYSP